MSNVCTTPDCPVPDEISALQPQVSERALASAQFSTLDLFFLSSALAVGNDKPLRIDPDNANGGRIGSLAEAWRTKGAFAIQPVPNVVPVDVDDESLLRGVREVLKLLALPILEIASRGATFERRHFWIWCEDQSEAERVANDLRSNLGGEVVRYGSRMRPPGSFHRSGIAVATPVDDKEVRSWVRALTPDPARILERLPSGLCERLELGVHSDRSKSDFRLMRVLAANGCTDAEIVSLAMLGHGQFGIKARERGHKAGLDYLLLSVVKSRSNAMASFSGRKEADAYLHDIECAVEFSGATPFGGSTGKKLMRGAVRMFREQSTIRRPLAIRDLAINGQMATSSVQRWLPRLVAAGWLVRTASGKGNRASVYTLKTPRMTTYLSTLGGVNRYVVDLGLSGVQSFRHGNLNESGREVVLALFASAGTARTGQIMEATGRSSSTVASALSRLQKEDIVERVSHGVWRLLDVDWNLLDEQTGADVVAKQQRASIDRERHQYGNYQIRRKGLGLEHQYTALNSRTAVRHETGELVPISDIG